MGVTHDDVEVPVPVEISDGDPVTPVVLEEVLGGELGEAQR